MLDPQRSPHPVGLQPFVPNESAGTQAARLDELERVAKQTARQFTQTKHRTKQTGSPRLFALVSDVETVTADCNAALTTGTPWATTGATERVLRRLLREGLGATPDGKHGLGVVVFQGMRSYLSAIAEPWLAHPARSTDDVLQLAQWTAAVTSHGTMETQRLTALIVRHPLASPALWDLFWNAPDEGQKYPLVKALLSDRPLRTQESPQQRELAGHWLADRLLGEPSSPAAALPSLRAWLMPQIRHALPTLPPSVLQRFLAFLLVDDAQQPSRIKELLQQITAHPDWVAGLPLPACRGLLASPDPTVREAGVRLCSLIHQSQTASSPPAPAPATSGRRPSRHASA